MKRFAFNLMLLVALAFTGWGAERKPNIILIVADDLGWADVSWHGGKAKTPALDRLAETGVRLEQHYVFPLCSPTRAALLTGRYASRFGCTNPQNPRVLPFDTVTLASALKSVGYDTALIGKWHLGSLPEWGPQKFGFDFSYGSLAGGVGPYDHRYKTGPY
ncbi:MAG: sulfatase-like hydrolase/transferase, partial [Verrucomicrobiae bacterium]|nr:sulfatase-like hydrolase/transferase [Verrucomicrobiae bacterium]